LECPPRGGISIPSARRLTVDVRPLSLRRRDQSLRRVSRRTCRSLNSFQHRTNGFQSFDTVVGILSSRPRDRASPQSRLPGVAVLDLVGRLEDNRFFRPCAQNCTATVQMDQERTRSSKASPLLHAASRGASYMCLEAQPEKAAPKKFREVRKTSNVLGSGFSAILKSG
jgi:hypothetical protein